jgi:hypothetical protein
MRLKAIENKSSKLYRGSFLETYSIKENLYNLLKLKNIYSSNIEISQSDSTYSVNTNLFFPTDKVLKYKKFLAINNTNLDLSRQFINIPKIFQNKNIILKLRVLNYEIDKKVAKLNFSELRKFRYSLFVKKYTMFFDLVKLASLVSSSRDTVHIFLYFLGLVFRSLPKKKHNLFISFLKFLLNLMIVKNSVSLQGMKITINGKLQGKTRAKTVKIHVGNVSINSLGVDTISSKIHVYTLYGAYGIQVLASYK